MLARIQPPLSCWLLIRGGDYNDQTGALNLKVLHYDESLFDVHKWVPCDALGYVSLDGTAYTGEVICTSECADGLGEFFVQHDRKLFCV